MIRLLIMISVLTLLVSCSPADAGRRELDHKAIYADLQAVEIQSRSLEPKGPVFQKGAIDAGRFDIVGLPSGDAHFPFTWLVLNGDDGNGGVLTVPGDGHIIIACESLPTLEQESQVNSIVRKYLQQRCTGG